MPAQSVILSPTDFSAPSTEALKIASAIARDRGARLLVLHVAPRPLSSLGGMQAVPPLPVEFDISESRSQLAKIQAPSGVSMETKLEIGAEADTILDVAKKAGCELIVMGTHGRSGLSRLLMGSVAEKVVRHAPCPVLTLKS